MTKTKTAVISAVLVTALGPVALLQHQKQMVRQENARLLQQQSELMAANASIKAKANRLTNQARSLEQANEALREQVAMLQKQNRAPNARKQSSPHSLGTAAEPESEPGVIRLRKENLHRLQFDAVNENFELTETSKDVLQLTPDELARITTTLQELKQRVHTHDLAVARQVPVEEVPDEDIVRFLKKEQGRHTTYRIPPFTPQEQQNLREWFGQQLEQILGSERNLCLVRNAKVSLDYWLGGTEDKILAFADRVDAQNTPVSSWMVKFNTPSSGGTHSGEIRNEAVPSQFQYLFAIHRPPNP